MYCVVELYVMTAKPSQRGNDDSEVLKFKDFQGPLTSNFKTFKALFHFQGLSRSWKNGKKISRIWRILKAVWPPWSDFSTHRVVVLLGNWFRYGTFNLPDSAEKTSHVKITHSGTFLYKIYQLQTILNQVNSQIFVVHFPNHNVDIHDVLVAIYGEQ